MIFKALIATLGLSASLAVNPDVKPVLDNPSGLWSMTLLGPNGENPVMTTDYAAYQGIGHTDSTLVIAWNLIVAGKECRVAAKVSLDENLPAWSIKADFPDGWTVTEIEFPIIRAPRPEGGRAIIPAGYGAEYELPTTGALTSRYPSVTGGMQFIMTHSDAGCQYMAALDTEGNGKYFQLKGAGENLIFSHKAVTSYSWTDEGRFELPYKVVFATNVWTWDETVLKWYKPFTEKCSWAPRPLKERTIVKWIQKADVWIRPKNMFPEVLDGVRKALKFYDKGLGIHWYHWHHHAYDTMYPEYFPPKPGFAEMVAEAQKAGAHVTPYINGRLWDPANESYKEKGYLASCRKPDGSLYTEIYPTSNVINTVTCPGSDVWHDVVVETPQKLIYEVGTHGVYIDQIGAAASEPCYATNHNHAPGAGDWWPKAYKEEILDLRSQIPSDRALTTEENAEPYLELFDMMLIVNTPHSASVKMLPIFPLVYSDKVVYSGLNYYHQELNDGHFLYNNARSLLWGAQLGWIQPDWLFAEGCEREQEFLRTLGRFRAKNHDIFYGGRFVREVFFDGVPEITVFDGEVFPTVMGAEWVDVKGRKATVIVNMDGAEHVVTTPDGREVKVKAYSALKIQ